GRHRVGCSPEDGEEAVAFAPTLDDGATMLLDLIGDERVVAGGGCPHRLRGPPPEVGRAPHLGGGGGGGARRRLGHRSIGPPSIPLGSYRRTRAATVAAIIASARARASPGRTRDAAGSGGPDTLTARGATRRTP